MNEQQQDAVILDIANMMDRIIDLQKGLIVKLFYLQLLL